MSLLRPIPSLKRRCAFFCLVGLAAALFSPTSSTRAAESLARELARALPSGDLGGIWRDPDFAKSFVGSYGFLSGAEPRISESESEFLNTLLELIESDADQAIRRLQADIRPENSAAFDFILGNLLFQSGRTTEAQTAYLNAIRKFSDFRRAHKNLGLLRIQTEEFDAAAESLARALELGDVDARTYGLLGFAHFQSRRFYGAEIAYRKAMLLQPQVLDWQKGLVRSLIETERPAESIALLDQMIDGEPERTDLWLLQANAHLTAGNLRKAARNLEMIHRLDAETPRISLLLGDIYLQESIPELALAAYLRVLDQENPASQFRPLHRGADILLRQGDISASRELIERMEDTLPDKLDREQRLELLNIRARLARASGELETARELLEEIVRKDSLNGRALIELGHLFAESGQAGRAIARFEQAQGMPDTEREALVAHAQLLVRENRLSDAVPLLRRALQLQPDPNLEDYLIRVERAARARR